MPFLFEGEFQDFSLGTAGGASCTAELQSRIVAVLSAAREHTHAVNGRFKGGYITRHYGEPAQDAEAVQLELAQLNYMDEDTFEYLDEIAAKTQRVLRALLEACLGR